MNLKTVCMSAIISANIGSYMVGKIENKEIKDNQDIIYSLIEKALTTEPLFIRHVCKGGTIQASYKQEIDNGDCDNEIQYYNTPNLYKKVFPSSETVSI